ncbi:MAG: glycoside hydrolase family 30 beta sandwich domain-containing protein [Promethearchaeia archaeon]
MDHRNVSEISFLNPDKKIVSVITNQRIKDTKILLYCRNKKPL